MKPRILVLDYATTATQYPVSTCTVSGSVNAALGMGHSQWSVTAQLKAGAEMAWDSGHGEEAVYVLEGCLELDGQPCAARSALIIEAGAAGRVRALEPTRIVHFGPTDPAPPTQRMFGPADPAGHRIRIVVEADSNPARHVGPDGTIYDLRFYSDSTAPTCRLALFGMNASQASDATTHSHTQDEIIHVLQGEIHVGKLVIRDGMAIAIQADQRYGFTSPGPLEFLNYRCDASYVINPPHPPILETAQASHARTGVD